MARNKKQKTAHEQTRAKKREKPPAQRRTRQPAAKSRIAWNCVAQQDCLEGFAALPDGSVDLAFADPPFNIGYKYDVYEDRRKAEDYLAWCRQWTGQIVRTLKPDGTFWLAIGDEFAAELKLMVQREHGMCCRSWVIWYYTFGVNCKYKFSRSHTHLFYFVKDSQAFTFNDQPIRVPSARQLVYGDGRAHPKGRLPDDTWILRPQDLPDGFSPDQDTWYYPRVCGTFKERAGFHGCQMPEQVLGRIISACSNAGETVLDPFAGSGTTLAVAKKLGRKYLGFELSADYARKVEKRLMGINTGDPLDGAADPLASAPTTARGRRLAEVPPVEAKNERERAQLVQQARRAGQASQGSRRKPARGAGQRALPGLEALLV